MILQFCVEVQVVSLYKKKYSLAYLDGFICTKRVLAGYRDHRFMLLFYQNDKTPLNLEQGYTVEVAFLLALSISQPFNAIGKITRPNKYNCRSICV